MMNKNCIQNHMTTPSAHENSENTIVLKLPISRMMYTQLQQSCQWKYCCCKLVGVESRGGEV